MTDRDAIERVRALRHVGGRCRKRDDATEPCSECQAIARVLELATMMATRISTLTQGELV